MKHHRRTFAVIGLSLTTAAWSLVAAPLSVAASKIKVSFSIAAELNRGGNDVVRLSNHEHFCVGYYFQSYSKTGAPDSNYGFEIRPRKTTSFEAPSSDEGERSTMTFYRCGHYKKGLPTVRFVFAREYKYAPSGAGSHSTAADAARTKPPYCNYPNNYYPGLCGVSKQQATDSCAELAAENNGLHICQRSSEFPSCDHGFSPGWLSAERSCWRRARCPRMR